MGNVLRVDFSAPRKSRHDTDVPFCQDPTLKNMIEAPEIVEPVRNTLQKLGLKDYDGVRTILGVPINYTSVDQDTDERYGTVDLVVSPGQKGRKYLIATTGFPLSLAEMGVPEDRVYACAASYAALYEALMTRDTSPLVSKYSQEIVGREPHIRNYWKTDTYPKERDICRIAAGISLLMYDIERETISTPSGHAPYPNWIAAFIDPVDEILQSTVTR